MIKQIVFGFLVLFLISEAYTQDSTLQIRGSVDVYFRENLSTTKDGGTPGTAFADLPGFAIGMANLVLTKEIKKSGFVADLVYGPRANEAVLGATNKPGIVNQLYVFWKLNSKNIFTLGDFNTFIGYELISPLGNFNYSTSYAFSYGPFSHAGLKYERIGSKGWKFIGAVLNATDMTEFNPVNTFTLGGQAAKTGEKGGAWLSVLHGDQDGKVSFNDSSQSAISQLDLTLSRQLTEKWNFAFNSTYKWIPWEIRKPKSSYVSTTIYLNCKINKSLKWGLRVENFSEFNEGAEAVGLYDSKGNATVDALTISLNYKAADLTLIPELRIDRATTREFKDLNLNPTNILISFLVAAVYSF